MANFQSEITVRAPLDQVFYKATDFANTAEFIGGISRVEMLTDGETKVGTRFRETRIIFGKEATEEMEVTAIEPSRLVELGAESCGMRYRSRFTFEPTSQSETLVRFDMQSTAMSTGAKIMGPVMNLMLGGTMRKMLEKDMADLKRACETGSQS